MNDPLRFASQFDACCQNYGLWIMRGSFAIEVSMDLEPIKEGVHREPSMRLRMSEAQNLMDSLWSAGLRPTGAKDPSGELAATKYHLEDIRRLTFTCPTTGLGSPGPGDPRPTR